jgi:MarR family transcriptional regulator, organic hydroperoxide resistance regulator
MNSAISILRDCVVPATPTRSQNRVQRRVEKGAQSDDFVSKSGKLLRGGIEMKQAIGRELRQGLDSVGRAKRGASNESEAKNQDVARQLAWEIAAINVHLEEIRYFWAKTLGISGPQWMILMALADLDQGEGVPVKVVSKMLHVDPSFVTTQSKMLEKKGFMRRKTSEEDARIVQMSLTDKTYKLIAGLASEQEALNNFIFAEFSDRELSELTGKLAALKKRLEKASLKVTMGI